MQLIGPTYKRPEYYEKVHIAVAKVYEQTFQMLKAAIRMNKKAAWRKL